MTHGLDHIPGAGFSLGADHGCTLANATQGFTQVAASANEWNLEVVLEDMVLLVRRGEHFRLIDVVHADRFQDLGFDEMPDAAFGHDRDGHRVHDLKDQVGVRHAGHTALGADIGRDPLQCHHGAGACIFGDLGMFGRDHIHDDAALQHLGQSFFHGKRTGFLFHTTLLLLV